MLVENHKLCLMSGLLVGTQPVVAKQRSSVGRVGLGKSWCSQQLVGFVPSLLLEMLERNQSI